MNLLKDDVTMHLDDLSRAAAEASGLYADLLERIEDSKLHRLVSNHVAAQTELMERIADLRRERGELPQAGDPERSHLEAAGAYLRAIVLPGETTAHYIETMLEAARNVAVKVDDALALGMDGELQSHLKELERINTEYETALNTMAGEAEHD